MSHMEKNAKSSTSTTSLSEYQSIRSLYVKHSTVKLTEDIHIYIFKQRKICIIFTMQKLMVSFENKEADC